MTAFVTGGSGAIGGAICVALSKLGFDVAVGYNSDEQSAKSIAEKIEENGSKAVAVKCNVADPQEAKNAVSLCEQSLGEIELLVNNAGVADINLFTHVSDERMQEIMSINLMGAMYMSKAVLPKMINRKRGNIINISSMWGEVGASCEVVYSASKAGLIGFTKALAKEVGLSGIRVNCITAGMIDTPMNKGFTQDEIAEIIDEIPLSRMGKPSDIANAVAFLSSEKASYITGATIKVNGGMCI